MFTMAESSAQFGHKLIPDGTGHLDPEGISPVSTEETIKEAPPLSRNLGVDKEKLVTQTLKSKDIGNQSELFQEQNRSELSENLEEFAKLSISKNEVGNSHSCDTSNGFGSRPHSLSLPPPLEPTPVAVATANGTVNKKSLSAQEKQKLCHSRLRTQSDVIIIPPTRRILEKLDAEDSMSKSLPHGTILKKGDMIEFIADDLQEMIRRSSPMSKTGSSNSRRSSVRSTASFSSNNSAGTSMATSTASGWSRSPSSLFQQSPDDIPPIDPSAILDLENYASLVADNVEGLMGKLQTSLHKMSGGSVACLAAYKDSVDNTCESVDTSIKSMYALMAKCEELNKTVEPVYQLANQIKEIKRLLDLFESQLADKPTKPS